MAKNPLIASLGQSLRFVRTQKRLKHEDVCGETGRCYLSKLEKGLKSPTLDKFDQLATALDVHPVTLFVLTYTRQNGPDLTDILGQV